MANIKSQIKRNRTNEKARMRNKSVKSSLKTAVRHFREAADADDQVVRLADEQFPRCDDRDRHENRCRCDWPCRGGLGRSRCWRCRRRPHRRRVRIRGLQTCIGIRLVTGRRDDLGVRSQPGPQRQRCRESDPAHHHRGTLHHAWSPLAQVQKKRGARLEGVRPRVEAWRTAVRRVSLTIRQPAPQASLRRSPVPE